MTKLKELLESMLECGYICPYGTTNIDCDDCLDKILEEHNAEIRRQDIDEFAEALLNKLPKAKETDEKVSYNGALADFILLINETVEKMKGETDGECDC